MRKMLVSTLLIFLLTPLLFTVKANTESEDAKQLLSAMKDIRYTVESGINFSDYSSVVLKNTVEYRKFIDNYPNSTLKGSALNVFNPYKDAQIIWKQAIYDKNRFIKIGSSECDALISQYPSIKSNVPIDYTLDKQTGHYYYKDLLPELWRIASTKEKEFQSLINQ